MKKIIYLTCAALLCAGTASVCESAHDPNWNQKMEKEHDEWMKNTGKNISFNAYLIHRDELQGKTADQKPKASSEVANYYKNILEKNKKQKLTAAQDAPPQNPDLIENQDNPSSPIGQTPKNPQLISDRGVVEYHGRIFFNTKYFLENFCTRRLTYIENNIRENTQRYTLDYICELQKKINGVNVQDTELKKNLNARIEAIIEQLQDKKEHPQHPEPPLYVVSSAESHSETEEQKEQREQNYQNWIKQIRKDICVGCCKINSLAAEQMYESYVEGNLLNKQTIFSLSRIQKDIAKKMKELKVFYRGVVDTLDASVIEQIKNLQVGEFALYYQIKKDKRPPRWLLRDVDLYTDRSISSYIRLQMILQNNEEFKNEYKKLYGQEYETVFEKVTKETHIVQILENEKKLQEFAVKIPDQLLNEAKESALEQPIAGTFLYNALTNLAEQTLQMQRDPKKIPLNENSPKEYVVPNK